MVDVEGYGRYKILKGRFYRRYHSLTSVLYIYCARCSAKVLAYQKDDKQGFLKRCYFNRIIMPYGITKRELVHKKKLSCPKCGAAMGRRVLFKGRRAFAVAPRTFKRRTIYKNWKQGVWY